MGFSIRGKLALRAYPSSKRSIPPGLTHRDCCGGTAGREKGAEGAGGEVKFLVDKCILEVIQWNT